MVKMSQAKIAEIQKRKEAQQKGKPGRVGEQRKRTQEEIDARKKAMYDARMEAHKKNKTGPFRVIPGRQRKMGGGMTMMPRAMYKKGGKALKPVDKEKNPGLAKLPTKVRNKMGFMKKGGSVKKFPDLSGDGKVTMKDILMGRGVIKRPKKKGGGLMEATSRLRAQGLKMGGIARGCGAVMSDRRKKTKMY